MKKTFRISANCTPMGAFNGDDADEAVLAYVRDTGYDSIRDAADVCGQTVEEFLGEIVCEDITLDTE